MTMNFDWYSKSSEITFQQKNYLSSKSKTFKSASIKKCKKP